VSVPDACTESRQSANRPGTGPVCFSGAAFAGSLAPSSVAWIALGANLGDASRVLAQAALALSALPWTQCLAASSLYRTRPVESSGPDYTNAVMAVRTALAPLELLHALQAIECAHGRERPYRNAPRTLDLDVIWHGGRVRDGIDLTLPHPRYLQRAFVIEPLAELVTALSSGSAACAGLERDLLAARAKWAPELPDITARRALSEAQGIEKTAEIWFETGSAMHSQP
jgi:2-amino-4-hydroxy-6-hydroxymethyldihydropteridine diphosphokinase